MVAESALDSGSDDDDLHDGVDLARKPWTKEVRTMCWVALRDSCLHCTPPQRVTSGHHRDVYTLRFASCLGFLRSLKIVSDCTRRRMR